MAKVRAHVGQDGNLDVLKTFDETMQKSLFMEQLQQKFEERMNRLNEYGVPLPKWYTNWILAHPYDQIIDKYPPALLFKGLQYRN